jgi:outer membrane protein assembly factor BamB
MTPRILFGLVVVTFLPITAHAQDGWLVFRGNLQRTGAGPNLPAFDKRTDWKRPLLLDTLDGFNDPDPDKDAQVLIDKLRKGVDPTILPGGFPIVVGDVCIYRSYRDVRAAAMREFVWKDKESGAKETFKASHIVWKSIPHTAALAHLLEKPDTRPLVPKLVARLQAEKQEHWVWANPLIGSLSSDGKNVFLISDFAFPGQDQKKAPLPDPDAVGRLGALFKENGLYVYDAVTGKVLWDSYDYAGRKSQFPDGYFLGAPVPLAGKLYALNETAAELRLLAIDLDRAKWKNPQEVQVEKSVTLTKIAAGEQVRNHALRRTQPLHIAQADGLLVCPTNAGVLLGVDRAKMEVRWKYEYRDAKADTPKLPHWQAACPIVVKDRIVFTAADAPGIHCIDLDGNKKWTATADKDLYLATVHDNIVMLVGRTHCRGLSLADGSEKWKIELGQPAGVGVKDGGLYYVPLQRDVVNEGRTIWALDITKGTKARRVQPPHAEALGNLALFRGMLVTQSATHIAAFPLGVK